MDRKIFERLKFDYSDIADAVRYGYKYGQESQPEEGGIIPDGNIQQWLISHITKTSDEWQRLTPETVVLNPDGWDRSDKEWKRSWYEEKISYQEYDKRRHQSTCMNNERV